MSKQQNNPVDPFDSPEGEAAALTAVGYLTWFVASFVASFVVLINAYNPAHAFVVLPFTMASSAAVTSLVFPGCFGGEE